MAKASRFKLTLSKLDFASIVSGPAQETAKLLLIKRAGAPDEFTATAKFVKANDELGLAWFWAFQGTTSDGTEYHDLQGDRISDDDSMIKACAEFMAGGANVDENHDGISGAGKIIFGMPMNAEVAKTYGLGDVKASGFMLVIKPAPAVLAKLKSGELNGISIAGRGERTPVTKVAPAGMCADCGDAMGVDDTVCKGCGGKQATKRVPVDVDLSFPGVTTKQLADAIAAREALAPTTIARAAQAAASKSTLATPTAKVAHMDEIKKLEAANAELTKRLERLDRIAKMSGAHKAHFDTLAGDDVEAFLAKSSAERETIVAARNAEIEKREKIAYVSKSDGTVYRESDDARLVAMAKREDAEIAKREAVEFEKRATEEIPLLKGTPIAKAALLKAVTGISDEKLRGEIAETLKGANAAMAMLGKTRGSSEGTPTDGDRDTAMVALEKGLTTFCKAQSITKNLWTEGLNAFVQTTEGAALKRAVDESGATA